MNKTIWTEPFFSSTFDFANHGSYFSKTIDGNTYYIRQATTPEDFFEVQRVQQEAWGWKDVEISPNHIISLWADTGGGIFVAYDENENMLGFAGGMGGGTDYVKTKKPCLVSSMLAIRSKDRRSHGLGQALKTIQAYYSFQNGYEMMMWYYDPERGENASLNLRKLGARAEIFEINKYGVMHSDLYGPVPTDRFRAFWRFNEPSVIQRLTGLSKPPSLDDVKGIPIARDDYLPDNAQVLFEISPNIDQEEEDVKIARRFKSRDILNHYFIKCGYIATEFVTGINQENRRENFYLLEPKGAA